MVKVNGEFFPAAGQTLAEFLTFRSFDLSRIAVERNGEIVPRAAYPELRLREGDSLEIVSFVGGG